jgi:hypothetical protein
MARTTGIELGPDSCVLAGVQTTRSGVEILDIHIIEPGAWPAHDTALAEMLRGVRQTKNLPRRARVVAWGLPEETANDEIARAAMRPILAAGFRVDRILTPPQALAILGRTRTRNAGPNTAVAWLSLNMHGVALAIVRGSELLFARTFQWTYNPHVLESKAQLLQRYSLVAHLAPEVHRGIAAVRSSYGVHVDVAVTCGDLPELRSLTMPLVEELDLEVETLDSLEGLRPAAKMRLEPIAESAPAIRLACAAALARAQRKAHVSASYARMAAAAAIVAAVGYGAYAYFTLYPPSAAPSGASYGQRRPAPTPSPRTTAPKPSVPGSAATGNGQAAANIRSPQLAGPRSFESTGPRTPAPASTPTRPTPATIAVPPVSPARQVPAPGVSSRVTEQRQADLDVVRPQQTPQRRVPGGSGLLVPVGKAGNKGAVTVNEPLPRVDSVLVDQERRLAIVDGAVVSVGREVGRRVVVAVDGDGVLFREPSGQLVKVAVRSRQ